MKPNVRQKREFPPQQSSNLDSSGDEDPNKDGGGDAKEEKGEAGEKKKSGVALEIASGNDSRWRRVADREVRKRSYVYDVRYYSELEMNLTVTKTGPK